MTSPHYPLEWVCQISQGQLVDQLAPENARGCKVKEYLPRLLVRSRPFRPCFRLLGLTARCYRLAAARKSWSSIHELASLLQGIAATVGLFSPIAETCASAASVIHAGSWTHCRPNSGSWTGSREPWRFERSSDASAIKAVHDLGLLKTASGRRWRRASLLVVSIFTALGG